MKRAITVVEKAELAQSYKYQLRRTLFLVKNSVSVKTNLPSNPIELTRYRQEYEQILSLGSIFYGLRQGLVPNHLGSKATDCSQVNTV